MVYTAQRRYVPMFGDVRYDATRSYTAEPLEAQMEALEAAQHAGKISSVGLSNETAWGLCQFCQSACITLSQLQPLSICKYVVTAKFDCFREGPARWAREVMAWGLCHCVTIFVPIFYSISKKWFLVLCGQSWRSGEEVSSVDMNTETAWIFQRTLNPVYPTMLCTNPEHTCIGKKDRGEGGLTVATLQNAYRRVFMTFIIL